MIDSTFIGHKGPALERSTSGRENSTFFQWQGAKCEIRGLSESVIFTSDLSEGRGGCRVFTEGVLKSRVAFIKSHICHPDAGMCVYSAYIYFSLCII